MPSRSKRELNQPFLLTSKKPGLRTGTWPDGSDRCSKLEKQRSRRRTERGSLARLKLCYYRSAMDEETANRIIDLQAEITALRGAVRMLLHNVYNADESALAILREKAFQADRFQGDFDEPNERSTRYREGVREAVASLLDPFQPDNDEASRLANPAPPRPMSVDRDATDPARS